MNLKKQLLAAATAMAPVLLALLGTLHAPQAQAKQCIFNKAGYVLHVHWFRQEDISVNQAPGDPSLGWVRSLRAPVQTAALTAGFGDCTKTDEVLVAVVSGIGVTGYIRAPGLWPEDINALPLISRGTRMRTHYNTGQADVFRTVAPLDCVANVSGHCKPAGTESAFKPPGVTLLVTEPSTTQYLDFAGSFFNAHWMPGGPIR